MTKIRAGLYSLCVADALGVPAESRTQKYLKKHPITGMVGGGLHGQPAGYWSDDSSMTLCLADSIGKVGYYYGYESIPAEWIDALVNKELIEECINRLEEHVDGLWDCF